MTTTIWEQLREPFPDNEVKHRPGAAKWDHKPNCAGKDCRETKDASKHHQFSYVDARAVAQRLDDVLTPAGWQFTCSVIPGTDIVKGHLELITETFNTLVREDHGYPNSDRDEEPLKAATSDALKRCAVLFGVGRHLYEDNAAPTTQGRAPAPPARPAPTPRPVVAPPAPAGGVPEEPEWVREAEVVAEATRVFADVRVEAGGGECPMHHLAWTLRPGGISKTTGKPYEAFWACPSQDRPFCKEKPAKAWAAQHEMAS